MRRPAIWAAVAALSTCVGCGPDAVTPQEPQGVQLDLPTSDWQPGDDMMFAKITGMLRLDDQGCLAFEGTRTPPVWPKGFTAYRQDGEVTLYGPGGEVVATDGDTIESGGGEVPVNESVSPAECLSATGNMLLVQGEVRVVRD